MQEVRFVFLLAVSLLTAIAIGPRCASADDVPRITKDELKSMLDDPKVVILDVIREEDWKLSERKIRGAVRESIRPSCSTAHDPRNTRVPVWRKSS
jgi:hypothetical protein